MIGRSSDSMLVPINRPVCIVNPWCRTGVTFVELGVEFRRRTFEGDVVNYVHPAIKWRSENTTQETPTGSLW